MPSWGRALGERLARLVGVALVVSFFSYLLLDLVPGDRATAMAGLNATPEVVEQIRSEEGLDDPILLRYARWLGDVTSGDLGTTNKDVSVWSQIRLRLPKTIELMVLGQLIALAIAIPLAIRSARNPGGALDRLASATAFGFLAMPAFVLGVYLQYFIAVRLGWLPAVSLDLPGLFEDPVENLRQMALPSTTLGVNLVAVYLRLLRTDLIATLQEDFVLLAQTRGFSERRVLWRHALRPSSLGLLTAVGLNTGGLIGGALIVEELFAIPGMGRMVVEAIFGEDYVLVQASVLILSVGYVLVNFLVDLLYAVVDPRIRHGAA